MTRVKICGITRPEDAQAAVDVGADAIGVIFAAESPRCVTPEHAAQVLGGLPPFVATVGVFVNELAERIASVARQCGLTVVQLHGEERPSIVDALPGLRILRALRVRDRTSLSEMGDWRVAAFVLDAYVPGSRGGTGVPLSVELARKATESGARVVLAGGLTPESVGDAVASVRPYAVDASSGVEERPGVKDRRKMQDFIAAVREADTAAEGRTR